MADETFDHSQADENMPISAAEGGAGLLDGLEKLNRIGAAINRLASGDRASMSAILRLIVESAVDMIAGASAVIYAYDSGTAAFDTASRVSSGELMPTGGDEPRPEGLGVRAIHQRRPILSYQEPDVAIHPAVVEAGAAVMAAFPLTVAQDCLGVLYVYLREPRHFTQLELLMLDNFVNQAATTLHHARQLARMEADLARKEDELVRLRRAGLLISSRLRLEETLEAILQMALEVTNARYGIFRVVDDTGQNLVTRAIAGERLGRPATEPLPLNATSITGWVARNRQPLLISDLHAEPWSRVYYPLDHELEMRSELTVPLIGADGRLEGVLNLESPVLGGFSEEDSHLLQALATQASIAIQQARLLDALQEIAGRLLAQPCQEVLDRLADLACELLNAHASAVWTLAGEQLTLAAAAHFPDAAGSLPLHGSVAGRAVLERAAVGSTDMGGTGLAQRVGWTGALVAPILSGDEGAPLGAFAVYTAGPQPGRFSDSDWNRKVLSILGHYAGLALHNATRQEALRQAQEQRTMAEAFAALGDISANLLHHLNNKVGAIPVRIEGIQDKCEDALAASPYLAANLGEIERSATEAMAVVRDSLSLLRPIELEPVSVAACVAAALESAQLPADVTVRAEGLASLPPVRAGQQSLSLVIVNLLQNAAEAMEGHGLVEIGGLANGEAGVPAGQVEITVADNGPGIPPALHDRIFEFNFSVRRTRRSKLGFGLWWVKTLMARLGGSVAVESDGHTGTLFRLRLPAAQPVGGQAAGGQTAERRCDG